MPVTTVLMLFVAKHPDPFAFFYLPLAALLRSAATALNGRKIKEGRKARCMCCVLPLHDQARPLVPSSYCMSCWNCSLIGRNEARGPLSSS